jgi:hypothetical protein
MMTDVIDAFMDRLFIAVPPLREEWERYLQTQQNHEAEGLGPPRPGVFLLSLARTSRDWFRSGDPHLHPLLRFLESELGRDPEIDELIETRFAAYLPEPGDTYDGMLKLLGPKLRAARDRQLVEDELAVPESTVDFLRRLADAVPSLRERVAEHFRRFNGRPLPHAFMGEIVFEAIRFASTGKAEVVQPLIDFLESEFGRDEDVDNVIAVSFIEMLPQPGERGADIEAVLGPKLRAELESQRQWSADRMQELAEARVVPPADGLDVGDDGGDR